jgi:hypothetical protein
VDTIYYPVQSFIGASDLNKGFWRPQNIIIMTGKREKSKKGVITLYF